MDGELYARGCKTGCKTGAVIFGVAIRGARWRFGSCIVLADGSGVFGDSFLNRLKRDGWGGGNDFSVLLRLDVGAGSVSERGTVRGRSRLADSSLTERLGLRARRWAQQQQTAQQEPMSKIRIVAPRTGLSGVGSLLMKSEV